MLDTKNDRFVQDCFIPIIKSGLEISPPISPTYIDYDRLIAIGSEQSVLPIIWNGLRKLEIKDEGSKQIDELIYRDIYKFGSRNYELKCISAILKDASIPYIPLKGSVLRDLYPAAWMRTSCDIDVLVPEELINKAVQKLEAKTDFVFHKRNYHDVSMMNDRVHLELHFSLKEAMNNIDSLLERVWEYVIIKENGEYVFTPEFQIFHVIAHMSYHFVHGGLGIRTYLDLWLLRNKTEYDENIVRQMCDQCNILKFYEACCALTGAWLEGKEYTEVTRNLERYCFEGGVFGNLKNAEISRQRNEQGFNYIVGRLFLRYDVLKEIYPTLQRYPFLLPYYQIRRWPTVFFGKRESVKEELRAMKRTNVEEIESFDRLMRSVGL